MVGKSVFATREKGELLILVASVEVVMLLIDPDIVLVYG